MSRREASKKVVENFKNQFRQANLSAAGVVSHKMLQLITKRQ